MNADVSGKMPLRRLRRPFFSWENYRLLFDGVFWLMVAITYWAYAVLLFDGGEALANAGYDPRIFGLLPVTLAFAAVVVSWHLLPWSLAVRRWRLLALPVFVGSVFWANYAMVLVDRAFYWPLFMMVFAHAVFLFGPVRSLPYLALVLGAIFVYLRFTDEADALEHALTMVVASPLVVFVVVACAAVLEATRRRGQAQELLEELGLAHAELREYAGRVREFSVSEERARMAREIHDSVGHYLAVVNVQLEAAGKLLARDPDAARVQLERAKASASGALSEVRRSVRALEPLAVAERSSTGALAALARGFEGAGPRVCFEVVEDGGRERDLAPEAELVLYRSLQEGLTNALKHGGAERISATLTFGPGRVRLVVADDGDGARCEPGEFMEGGFGLRSLSERAAALGGTAEAGNAPGGGFVLDVDLPAGEATG